MLISYCTAYFVEFARLYDSPEKSFPPDITAVDLSEA